MFKKALVAIILLSVLFASPASAKPSLIKCPDNTHIWAESQMECRSVYSGPIGFGGAGDGSGRRGIIGEIIDAIGGLIGGIL